QDQILNEELGELTTADESTEEADSIKIASIVSHKIFGDGEVLEIGENDSCKVLFYSGKVRFLRASSLELKKNIL
ncbi:MAG: hypothetical protein MJY67_05950, partial [Bacteroidales bacterium]|nr:hypothetical protein [Bacteroidales bacterium]